MIFCKGTCRAKTSICDRFLAERSWLDNRRESVATLGAESSWCRIIFVVAVNPFASPPLCGRKIQAPSAWKSSSDEDSPTFALPPFPSEFYPPPPKSSLPTRVYDPQNLKLLWTARNAVQCRSMAVGKEMGRAPSHSLPRSSYLEKDTASRIAKQRSIPMSLDGTINRRYSCEISDGPHTVYATRFHDAQADDRPA